MNPATTFRRRPTGDNGMASRKLTGPLFAALCALALGPVPAQDAADPAAEATTTEATPTPAPAGAPAPKIEATVEEINSMIGLPSTASLARESDEDPAKPKSMFTDDTSILAVFGEKPSFVYFPEGVDPMVIPWVRQQIIAQELLDKARVLAAAGDDQKAMATLQEILDKYVATPSAQDARRELDVIRARISEPTGTTTAAVTPEDQKIQLPKAVADNTKGIFYFGGAGSQVVIFDEILGVGDRVPKYANVTIKDIQPGLVVFEFQGRQFEVQVDGSL